MLPLTATQQSRQEKRREGVQELPQVVVQVVDLFVEVVVVGRKIQAERTPQQRD